jgi:hypothetical protein
LVGYEYPEMRDILAIVDAVNAYKSGKYNFPTSYHIPHGIPPKTLQSQAPGNVLSWESSHNFVLPSTPNSKSQRSQQVISTFGGRQDNFEGDLKLNIFLNGLSLSPSPSTPQNSSTDESRISTTSYNRNLKRTKYSPQRKSLPHTDHPTIRIIPIYRTPSL